MNSLCHRCGESVSRENQVAIVSTGEIACPDCYFDILDGIPFTTNEKEKLDIGKTDKVDKKSKKAIQGRSLGLNRREFTALIGAGIFFPRNLLGVGTEEASLAGLENDDSPQYYPIYYSSPKTDIARWHRAVDTSPVYMLWHPGIIIDVGVWGAANMKIATDSWQLYTLPDRLYYRYSIFGYGAKSCYHSCRTITDAIRYCPAHGLILDRGCATHFTGCGDFWHHNERNLNPIVLDSDHVSRLEQSGHLDRVEPICSLGTYFGSTECMIPEEWLYSGRRSSVSVETMWLSEPSCVRETFNG